MLLLYDAEHAVPERKWRMSLAKVLSTVAAVLLGLSLVVWFFGSANPRTQAGYVGYVTQDAVFGKTKFLALQTGPTSCGRTWLAKAVNVSITPYTYSEEFTGPTAVLAKDNLSVSFNIHSVFRIRPDRVQEFVEKYSYLKGGDTADSIVSVAYGNFVKEPLRTYARDRVQQYKGLEIKDNIAVIGSTIQEQIKKLTDATPFEVISIVVGNIQYPEEVSTAVAKKLAATQLLEEKETQIKIAEADAQKRVAEADGIAKATKIINRELTPEYLQHEAIEAQKAAVNSPNHTVIYVPSGAMGVPLTGVLNMSPPARTADNPKQ